MLESDDSYRSLWVVDNKIVTMSVSLAVLLKQFFHALQISYFSTFSFR